MIIHGGEPPKLQLIFVLSQITVRNITVRSTPIAINTSLLSAKLSPLRTSTFTSFSRGRTMPNRNVTILDLLVRSQNVEFRYQQKFIHLWRTVSLQNARKTPTVTTIRVAVWLIYASLLLGINFLYVFINYFTELVCNSRFYFKS